MICGLLYVFIDCHIIKMQKLMKKRRKKLFTPALSPKHLEYNRCGRSIGNYRCYCLHNFICVLRGKEGLEYIGLFYRVCIVL